MLTVPVEPYEGMVGVDPQNRLQKTRLSNPGRHLEEGSQM